MSAQTIDKKGIRWDVFIPCFLIIGGAAILGVVNNAWLTKVTQAVFGWSLETFGWLYQWVALGTLILITLLAFSPLGKIRFGGPQAKAKFSFGAWFAMTLTGGIATGLITYGVNEPLIYYGSVYGELKETGVAPFTQEASFYEMELSARDFLRLGRFRRKTDARIHILSKNGLPFFLLHARKRKAFFLGIFLGFFLLFVCSLRIWDIQITGNRYYTTPVLLDTLSEWDIHCGMAKKNVDCQKLMQKIRQAFPGVVWVSAKLEGTCLIIDIRENDEIPQSTDALADTLTSWDLAAPWNGTVVSIITRMGMPQVKPGDVCKKGDILVSGSVAILDNDSQIQRYEYVRADADIVIKTQFPYYDEFSRTVTVKSYPGEQESYPFFTLFGTDISWYHAPKNNSEIYRIERRLTLTPSFYLPVTVGKIITVPYEKKSYCYTPKESLELSQKHLQNFLKNLVREDALILSRNIRTRLTANRCRSQGYVIIQIPGSEKTPIVRKALPDSMSSVSETN